jgi:hypothetical protein
MPIICLWRRPPPGTKYDSGGKHPDISIHFYNKLSPTFFFTLLLERVLPFHYHSLQTQLPTIHFFTPAPPALRSLTLQCRGFGIFIYSWVDTPKSG